DSLLESARIDGASEYRTFWSIIMPQDKPAWLTLAILEFQNLWRLSGSNYIYREELKTLPYAMSQIVAGGIIRAGAGAAATVILMAVPIIFFILAQTQILQTMASSGIKE
ncbi:MAG: ABC transporter permease subunit, partial [Atribacterota bacterium]|nr:ABC transporter permease subunit [Atribacterota bacterium]